MPTQASPSSLAMTPIPDVFPVNNISISNNQSILSMSSSLSEESNRTGISAEEKLILDDFFSGSIFDQVTESIIIMIFSILITTGFLFNLIMIVVILLSEKLRRMPFNLLLLNLCFSNILLSIFCMPFTLLGLIRRGWFFGPALCKIIPSLQGVGVCVSATTVTVIACDRYFTIVYQENHQRSARNRSVIRSTHTQTSSGSSALNRSNYAQVLLETIIIWIIGIICGLPVSVFQIVITFPQYSSEYIQCIEDWPKTLKSAYSVSILIVQCVLPSVALVLTGQAITSHLNRVAGLLSHSSAPSSSAHHLHHHHQLNNSNATGGSSAAFNMTTIIVTAASPANEIGGEENNGESQRNGPANADSSSPTAAATASTTTAAAADCHQRNLERNQSVTRTLLAVSISFTVCWMPLHILNALIDLGLVTHEIYSEHMIYLMIAICSSIAMTSVPLNALLYGWYNPSINREVISWRLIANASLCRRDSSRIISNINIVSNGNDRIRTASTAASCSRNNSEVARV